MEQMLHDDSLFEFCCKLHVTMLLLLLLAFYEVGAHKNSFV